jgi:hypothetical protein
MVCTTHTVQMPHRDNPAQRAALSPTEVGEYAHQRTIEVLTIAATTRRLMSELLTARGQQNRPDRKSRPSAIQGVLADGAQPAGRRAPNLTQAIATQHTKTLPAPPGRG